MSVFHPYPKDRNWQIEHARKLAACHPVFLDTETTGLGDHDEICEIAVVDLEGKVLISTLVRPGVKISAGASQIHGITDDMVKDAPRIADVFFQLHRILEKQLVLIYNADFDIQKIWYSMHAQGIAEIFKSFWWDQTFELEPSQTISLWLDIMRPYAAFHGAWNDYRESYAWQKLGNAAEQCSITLPEDIHRAHADAEMARQIFLYMAAQELVIEDEDEKEGTE